MHLEQGKDSVGGETKTRVIGRSPSLAMMPQPRMQFSSSSSCLHEGCDRSSVLGIDPFLKTRAPCCFLAAASSFDHELQVPCARGRSVD